MNLNQQVKVVLTSYGADVFNNHHAGNKYYTPPIKVCGDEFKSSLWGLMQIFGSSIYLGMQEVPFKDNEMEICKMIFIRKGRTHDC